MIGTVTGFLGQRVNTTKNVLSRSTKNILTYVTVLQNFKNTSTFVRFYYDVKLMACMGTFKIRHF